MQRGASSSAQELLRASATDAVAVRHYLESIDADEVSCLPFVGSARSGCVVWTDSMALQPFARNGKV